MFIEGKDGGSGGGNWSYKSCKATVKSSPPTDQYQVFFTGWMPFLPPNQQCQSTEGKMSHFMDLLTPGSPGVFQLCLSSLIAPGFLWEGCHCSHQPSDASTPMSGIRVVTSDAVREVAREVCFTNDQGHFPGYSRPALDLQGQTLQKIGCLNSDRKL